MNASTLNRRRFGAVAAAWLAAPWTAALGQAASPGQAPGSAPALRMDVWKSPSCGCCGDWVAIMEKAGFTVRVHDVGNAGARRRLKVPVQLGSCHTAQVGPYAVEGHVPAREIQRLLRERPDAIGLTVPGMPVGSPGMDGPEYGDRRDPYDVLLIRRDGSTVVYASYFKDAKKA
ncbi:MAG: DUF411 domain-containing protein [Rubrivivax sp.]|nr:DUF411 domain-containing protein [Rubrivivax sp.]